MSHDRVLADAIEELHGYNPLEDGKTNPLDDEKEQWVSQEHFNGVEDSEEIEPVEEADENDPFSAENINTVLFIQQSRIYDTLMSILTLLDKDVAKDLLELHSSGNILTPMPVFNGNFITDLLNEPEAQED
jgi:hypothetical protein